MKERLLIVTLHFIFKVPWEPRWKRSCILIEIISSRPICLLPSFNLQHVLPYAKRKLKKDCCKIVQTSCFAKFEYLNWLNKVTFGNLRIKTHGYLASRLLLIQNLGVISMDTLGWKPIESSAVRTYPSHPLPLTSCLTNSMKPESFPFLFFFFFLQSTTWSF